MSERRAPKVLAKAKRGKAREGSGGKALPKKPDGVRGPAALGYTKPRTYEELRAVLSSGTIHFPKRLRQVAIFLWQHPSNVALGTISQVAEQAGVQPSTLVRFAQIFGYGGFSDFQGLFKEHMQGIAGRRGARATGARCGPGRADQRQSPLHERHGRGVAGFARAASATVSTSRASSRWSSCWPMPTSSTSSAASAHFR